MAHSRKRGRATREPSPAPSHRVEDHETKIPEIFVPEAAGTPPADVFTPSESPAFESAALPRAVAVQAALVAAVEAPRPPPAGPPGDAQASILAMFEKGIEEMRTRYALAHSAAQDAAAAVETSYGAAQDGVAAMQAKTIEGIQAGADAHFDLMASLAGARTLSELVTAHTEFARRQFDAQSAHARQLADLARKIAEDAAAPFQAHVAKTFKA